MTEKNKTNIWPSTLPTLKAIDFCHGGWELEGGAWCGKARCMVGWVGSAFHDNALIAVDIDNGLLSLGRPARKFLLNLLSLAGRPTGLYKMDGSSDKQLVWDVSYFYEGADGIFEEVSSEAAARLWNRAVKACGYTESTYVFID